MARKVRLAAARIAQGAFVLPSPAEVAAARSPSGAWTAGQLAEWGVPWPPRHGWRAELKRRWECQDEPEGPVTEQMKPDVDLYVIQRIQERLDLGHIWRIEELEDGDLTASATTEAAASVWRVVQDAVKEIGGSILDRQAALKEAKQ